MRGIRVCVCVCVCMCVCVFGCSARMNQCFPASTPKCRFFGVAVVAQTPFDHTNAVNAVLEAQHRMQQSLPRPPSCPPQVYAALSWLCATQALGTFDCSTHANTLTHSLTHSLTHLLTYSLIQYARTYQWLSSGGRRGGRDEEAAGGFGERQSFAKEHAPDERAHRRGAEVGFHEALADR